MTLTVKPVATNDSYTTSTGNAVVTTTGTGVLANDLGTGLTENTVVANPTNGTLTLNVNGSFTYTPERWIQRHRHVHLHDKDTPGQTSNTATVTITVNPVAVTDSYTVFAGTPLTTTAGTGVLANDQGSSLTKNAVAANPASGTLTLNADGSFTYTANTGFSGADAFTYSAKDPSGLITHCDAHGEAGRDERQLHDVHGHRGGHTAGTGVLANDLGTGLTENTVVTNPTNGTLTLNANGSFTYTPTAGFSGVDTFTYNVKDTPGQISTDATVTITVNPVAVADSYTVFAGTPLTTTAGTGVLANDQGSSLTKNSLVTNPASGTLTLNADGSFTYTANAGFSGADAFTYNAKDPSGLTSNTVTVTLTVKPVAVNDSYTTSTGSALTTTAGTGVLANDLGAGLTENTVVASPTNGTLTLNANGSFTYTPNAGFSGIDTFTYNDSDTPGQTSNTATVTITVNPVAVADSYTVFAGTPLTTTAGTGILANDQGSTLTKNNLVSNPANGSLSLNADGSFTYTANVGFSGTDAFTYNAKDPSGLITNTVTVTLTVKPVAINDSYTTSTGSALTTTAGTGVLANDRGAGLTENTVVTSPTNGTLTINADGSFTYTPNAGFSGIDTFTYTDTDTPGQTSNAATVTITVNPVAVADSYTVFAGTPLTTTAGTGILANDQGSTLTKNNLVSNPANGSLSLNADGSFTYTANVGFSGADAFTYNAKDPSGLITNTVTVTLTVKPVAINDNYTTSTGSALTTTAGTGVLANDRGAGLAENAVVTSPTNGTLTINADGSFTYTPNAGFSGTDTFTYNDTDTPGQTSNTATVTITVNPVAVADSYTVSAGTPLTTTAGAGHPGHDQGTTLTKNSLVTNPANGSLALNCGRVVHLHGERGASAAPTRSRTTTRLRAASHPTPSR